MNAVGPDLIVFLDPSWNLFGEISRSDSDISVLSDPFSDSDDDTAPARKQDLTGKDVFSAFDFSQKFREAVVHDEIPSDPQHSDKTVVKLKSVESMMAETPDQVRVRAAFTQIRKKVPLVAQIKIVNLLNDKDITFPAPYVEGDLEEKETFIPDEKKTWEDLKDEIISSRTMLRNIRRLTERERSRKAIEAQAELDGYDTMSGYWRLLSEYDQFRISPPDYDAYAGPEPHWLETEPIPWQVMENSKRKVLRWLSKHFSKY